MQGKTLTDLFIEEGLIEPVKCSNRLDGEGSVRFVLDGEESQKEEKGQA